jgi:hypothetical protein
MGSSFIDFNGYGFWARDTHIDLWLYLLVQEIDELESIPDWLSVARDHWREQATLALVGCVHSQLDDYLVSQDRVDFVMTLSESVLKLLGGMGEYLSGEHLNSLGVGGGGYQPSTDFEVENFTRVGQKFIELLRGELKTDSSTVF